MTVKLIKHIIYILILSCFLAGISVYWVFNPKNLTIFQKINNWSLMHDDENIYRKSYFIQNRIFVKNPLNEIILITYFDDNGKLLNGNCNYIISGNSDIKAQFWILSITDNDDKPFENEFRSNSSLNSKNIIRESDGKFKVNISSNLVSENWLASKLSSNFKLIWSLKGAPSEYYQKPEILENIKIIKTGCL